MDFPPYYPKQCPPEGASDVEGNVIFRFVRALPPSAEEFIPYSQTEGKSFSEQKRCEACGLSVFKDESNVRFAKDASPFFRKRFVVKARLEPEWGKIAKTDYQWKGHHTWWVPIGKSPESIFEEVDVK